MANESRVKKTLLNARVNLIFYFLTLALSFFSRKIFFNTLGANFIGLTGTLTNLLSFLNLAELGIGTAIGYVLYKPLFAQDQTKINEIISVLGYLYNWVGKIILISGCILSLFLPLIFPNTGFDLTIIYLAYYSFLASSLIGYFINYRQTLLGADQKNYVVTAYFQTGNIVKTFIQMASAYYTHNYYIWIFIEFFFGIIYSFILNWKINKVYPWLKSDIKNGKQLGKKYPEVMKHTKQIFVHKIASLIQFQLTPFLIYAFVSLQTVAFYGNYTIIIDKIRILFDNFLGSTAAGIGNLIAEGNKEKIQKVYWELIALRFFFVGITTYFLLQIIPLFITLWLGKEYILSNTTLIILLSIFSLNILRGITDQFINGYGLFHDIWSPITESILYFVVAIIGGSIWGLEGVLLGNLLSITLIIHIWKPYFLFKRGFKIPVWIYWLNFIKLTSISLLTYIIFYFVKEFILNININNLHWENLIIYSIYTLILLLIIHFSLLYISSKSMRNITKKIIHAIIKH